VSSHRSGEPQLLETFIKSVQYIVGLETQQDVRDHVGKLITAHLPAEWVAFAQCEAGGCVTIDHCTLDEPDVVSVLAADAEGLIADVLDSGFLACGITAAAAPSMTAFIAIVEESQPRGVMLVGHKTTDPIPRDLLNIYLAIAGLAGTTQERLRSEIELARYRSHLEELVVDRTAELQRTNEQLLLQIAERQAAQKALHSEHERLSITLRSIGDGVIATDTEARVVLLNGAAEEMTRWTLKDALGRPIAEVFDIVNEQTREPVEIPVAKALQTGAVLELANHTVLIARDGTELSIADSCAPIKAQDGSITGAVLVFRDVTEQHRSERLRDALNQINTAISSSLDVGAIMRAVVDEAAQALGCAAAIVQSIRGGAWEVSHASENARALMGERFGFDEAPGLGVAWGSDPRLLVASELGEVLPARLIDALDAESLISVPIVIRGELVAALGFVNLPSSPLLTATQLDFVRRLGSSLSLALENARLYEAERLISQTLQEALICIPQALPGMDIGHHYRSATKAAKVGGDFYDVFQIQPGKVGIVMGDVAGHGLSAATLTLLVLNTTKALAHQGYSPGDVMRRANDIIMEETEEHVFVTIFFGVLDLDSGRLRYCSGGHPPAVMRRRDGELELLGATCPVVGAFTGLSVDELETHMATGDMLVLYTDGVTEARNPDGEFFGQVRLLQTIEGSKTAAELTQHVFDGVLEFTGGALNDDVAILSISPVGE